MHEQKSLFLEVAEAIDRRLQQRTPQDEGPPPEARRPRWLRWLGRHMVPNVGTLLMVVVLLLTVPSLAAPLRAPAAPPPRPSPTRAAWPIAPATP